MTEKHCTPEPPESNRNPDPPKLSDRHRDELHASGLTDETIAAAGIYTAKDSAIADILGQQPRHHAWGAGLVFPFADDYMRVKLDWPRPGSDGRFIKYESPCGKGNRAYFPPNFAECLSQSGTIVVTEGEKKALAISQLGIACIGLVGVWGWQQARLKTDTGKPYGERRLIADLDKLEWNSREVLIAFDSDAETNSLVRFAEAKLAELLASKGATVKVARIPADGDAKVGADDYIVKHGADAFRELLTEAKPAEKPPKPTPMDYARMIVTDQFTVTEGTTVHWHRDDFYVWRSNRYEIVPTSDLQCTVLEWLDERGEKATPHFASDVRQCLASVVRIPHDVRPPVFIGDDGDSKPNLVAMRNGLLDLDELLDNQSPKLRTHTPRWFSTFALTYDYDATAECPVWFETLDAIFDGDEERVDLLGEWFGYCLTEDTSLHAIMLMEGPPRSGKSTILRTLAATVGNDNCVCPSLTSLGDTFGLWPFLGKRLAYCPDAHLGHGNAAMGVLERLKSISGEDPVDVHRKNLPTLTNVRLRIKFALAVNELPKFGDYAGALGPRVCVLPFRRSFAGHEDRTLEQKLLAELPGIFRWAMEGRIRLAKQGRFTKPAISCEVEADFARLVSPIKGFLEDRCDVRPGAEVSREDLWIAWKLWCDENGHMPGSKDRLGAWLRSVIPSLDTTRPRDDTGARVRMYVGLRLNIGLGVTG